MLVYAGLSQTRRSILNMLRDPSARCTSSTSRAAASWASRQGERVTLTVDETQRISRG